MSHTKKVLNSRLVQNAVGKTRRYEGMADYCPLARCEEHRALYCVLCLTAAVDAAVQSAEEAMTVEAAGGNPS